jgi:putative flavoprotein involved in K+ transport
LQSSAYDAVVIGAGPAGLATSRELLRAGVRHVVLERGDRVGYTWANLYDSLVLHTGKHLSALPGMRFPRSSPLFPARLDFLNYLEGYAARFGLPVMTRTEALGADRDSPDGILASGTRTSGVAWTIRTAAGRIRARALVVATGIVSNPYLPDIGGRDRFSGRIMHSVMYRRPDEFTGQRVLVVGAGNSAGEIAADLAGAGVRVAIAVRSGARVVPRQLLGIPIQYFAVMLTSLPRGTQRTVAALIARVSELRRGPAVLPPPPDTRCSDVPLIGFHLTDALRAGTIQLTPGVAELTGRGARFVDGSEGTFDQIIFATGYRAALGVLGHLIRLDGCGFASRRERVVSCDQPGLYFVGHNYDTRGGLRNIACDARLAAVQLRTLNSELRI